jgi:hypothetical protein
MELIYRELAFYLTIAPKPTLQTMVLKSFQAGTLSPIEVYFSPFLFFMRFIMLALQMARKFNQRCRKI